MKLVVGYIPYLNMVPFHQGFGPDPLQWAGDQIQFKTVTPNALGLEAEQGRIHAGAMSLVDLFRLADQFRPLGDFGIGVQRAAGSVLLFSKKPLSELEGICAVTDETSTSVRLLHVLLEQRYQRHSVSFGRIGAGMYDGSADSLLLIGDAALQARQTGVKGLPVVTDLATEWFAWQGTPFVFAQWAVRKDVPAVLSDAILERLHQSLQKAQVDKASLAAQRAVSTGLTPDQILAYWEGFDFRLTAAHRQAIEKFKECVGDPCLSA